MGPQDVIQIALLIGMGLQGGHGDYSAAADDLVARDLWLDQMLLERWLVAIYGGRSTTTKSFRA